MGYTCRMTEIIRLLTTKTVAVPKISSTVRDLYGQATLSNIQRRTCFRHSSWTAWPLKMRSTGCRRSHFVYYYIIKSVSTDYVEKSPFSTAKLLNQTINYLSFNPLNAELNPMCYLLALLGAYHFLHVSRIWDKSLTLRLLMSYIYGAPILDVSRSNTTTQHSR